MSDSVGGDKHAGEMGCGAGDGVVKGPGWCRGVMMAF